MGEEGGSEGINIIKRICKDDRLKTRAWGERMGERRRERREGEKETGWMGERERGGNKVRKREGEWEIEGEE